MRIPEVKVSPMFPQEHELGQHQEKEQQASSQPQNIKDRKEQIALPGGGYVDKDIVIPLPDKGKHSDHGAEEGTPDTRPCLSIWKMLCLASVWFGTSCCTDLLFFVAVPSQIRGLVGDEHKTIALSMTVLITALMTIIAGPLVGKWSDGWEGRWGKRRPFLFGGAICVGLFMMLQAFSNTYLPAEELNNFDANCTTYNLTDEGEVVSFEEEKEFEPHGSFVAFVVSHIFLALALLCVEIPFNGFVADLVPASQRGRASSWIGVGAVLGSLMGSGIGLWYRDLGVLVSFGIAAGIIVVSVLLGCTIHEEPIMRHERQPRESCSSMMANFMRPFKSADFCWLFATRLLMMMGMQTIGSFLEYWLVDVIELPANVSPERGVAILVAAMVLPSFPSSSIAGALSDRSGKRKIFVLIGGLLMTVGPIMYIVFSNFYLILIFSGIAGLGFGVYSSLDYALALDVLHDSKSLGMDLAVWHQAEVLPRLIATPIAAAVIEAFQRIEGCSHSHDEGHGCGPKCTLGWHVLWVIVSVYFIISSLFVYRIKGAK